MEVKFDVKMTQKIMFDFMMNHTYKSLTGVMGILFGISAFVIFARIADHPAFVLGDGSKKKSPYCSRGMPSTSATR